MCHGSKIRFLLNACMKVFYWYWLCSREIREVCLHNKNRDICFQFFSHIVSGSFAFVHDKTILWAVYVHTTFGNLDLFQGHGNVVFFIDLADRPHSFICTDFENSTNCSSSCSARTFITVFITSKLGQPHWLPTDARISWICLPLFQRCYLHIHSRLSLWSPAAVFSFLFTSL